MYAIFENGSKQYKACLGDIVKVEKLKAEVGATVKFPVVMTADDKGNVRTGKEVENISVAAEVTAVGKDKKIIVFKYKAKKNERKKQGHRQPYSTVRITAIGDEVAPAAPKKTAKPAAKKAEEAKAEIKEVKAEVKEAPKSTATKSTAAKSTATKTAATKSTAAKSTATKSTAAKTATAKSSTAAKPAATKSTAAKKPAAKKD